MTLNIKSLILNTTVACSVGIIAACSSSSDSTSTTPETLTTTSSISGSIFAAPVNGAEVSVEDMSGNTVAGPVTTNADGTYTIDVPDSALSSDLVVKSNGGIFDDEATDALGVGTAAGALSAFVESGSLAAGVSVHVTPSTTIHAGLVTQHGKTALAAKTAVFNAFAYNSDTSVQPVDITEPEALTASDASRLAGYRAAVFSQLAQNLGLSADQQFDLFAALAQDLSDDVLDGVDASGAVAIGSTGTFLPADILSQYISTAASFTEAETANYRISYSASGMTTHGKEKFTLTITDLAGAPVTGLVLDGRLSVMPMMYMADLMHSTPLYGIEELANPGEYEVTLFYLMPSRMMDGTTMGTWSQKVMIDMESAFFYPNVMMAMGDTVRVQLKGVDDTIIDMNGLEVGRTYNLFKDSLTGDNTFEIFIAPIETMLSFPPLVVGDTLESGMGGTPYDVTSVAVDVSVNGGPWMLNHGTDNGDGTWTLDGLGLNSGENELRVRLTVSSEIKTTNALPAETDVNDFATFTVTVGP